MIRKLSTAKIVGKVRLEANEEKRLLYQLVGISRSFKNGESNFGPYTAFKGDFIALPAKKGEIAKEGFRAPVCFVPEPFSGMMESTIAGLEAENIAAKAMAMESKTVFMPTPVELSFKVNVWIVADERSNTGYTYEIENLIEYTGSERLQLLIDGETVDPTTGEIVKTEKKKRK